MGSIPPFLGGEMRCRRLSHSLRMTNRLMAAPADADQVAFPLTISICVVNIQSQIRPELHMIDMMDQICPVVSSLGFADLALMAIIPKHIST